MALVPLPDTTCPTCLTTLVVLTVRQAALLRHGGYGATTRTVTRRCPTCLWDLEAEREEERPAGDHPR